MSIKLMTRVFDESKSKGNSRLILLALCDTANDDGECYPSVAHIARKAAVSEKIARIYLKAYRTIGLLHISPRFKSGRQTSSLYQINTSMIGNDAIPHEVLRSAKPKSWQTEG